MMSATNFSTIEPKFARPLKNFTGPSIFDLKCSFGTDFSMLFCGFRANKVFYNGFLNKKKMKQYSAEQQAHATELQHFLKTLIYKKHMIGHQSILHIGLL